MDERRLDRELEFHLDQLRAKYVAQGMTEAEARRRARLEFGGVEQLKEECRDTRPTLWVDSTLQDIRFALRTMRKNPVLTITIVATLALGIGANTAIFSVLNAVLLRSLPYPDADRLVALSQGTKELPHISASYPNYLDWRKLTRTCEDLGAAGYASFLLTGPGQPERLLGRYASASIFSVLRVTPVLGRGFRPEEDSPGGRAVAMISESLWTRRFSRDPALIGQSIRLNGTAHTVVGVLPSGFQFPGIGNFETDIVTPLGQVDDALMQERGFHPGITVVGRLRPGETVPSARAEYAHMAQLLATAYPKANQGHGISVTPLRDIMVGGVRADLYILMGAVTFVLLIACANVANLLLARSSVRREEIGMRIALGAGRLRMVRQMLTESALLALSGGVAGLLLAWIGTRLLVASAPASLPQLHTAGMDGSVVAFSLLISLCTGFLFGFAPALQCSRLDLRDSSRHVSARRGIRDALAVGEVALALPLLVAGALLIRTLWNLQDVNPGFDAQNIIAMQLSLSPGAASSPASIRRTYPELIARMSNLPGVASAAAILNLPMDDNDMSAPIWIEGTPRPRSQSEMPVALMYPVTPAYLDVLKIPLLRGRFITEHDDEQHPPVVVIDEVMARTLFPGRDPIGQRLRFGGPGPGPASEVIGIVGHVKHNGLDDDVSTRVHAQSYISLVQMPPFFLNAAARGGTVVLRARSNSWAVAEAARRAIQTSDPEDAVSNVRPMPEIVSHTLASRRFLLALLGAFAGVAVLLASVGIYGVMSYSVTQRTREIGVRMALGAARGDILKSIVGHGATLAAAGIVLGLGASLFLTRFLASFLYGVGRTDPLTFIGVAATLALVAIAASFLPALRGSRADPLVALRCE